MSPPASRDVPATLDHAGIAARVPHAGAMCLLERLSRWDDDEVECAIVNHADAAHPLRDRDAWGDRGLPAPVAIEYAAQAMALHAALKTAAGETPTPGFLASARDVQLHVPRLDGARGPLAVIASRQASDAKQAMYRFALRDAAGATLVEGRATVVLNTPLPRPASSPTP
jgi:predicted hotdog family 3-hydroxylacyl-ACP dehydratase